MLSSSPETLPNSTKYSSQNLIEGAVEQSWNRWEIRERDSFKEHRGSGYGIGFASTSA